MTFNVIALWSAVLIEVALGIYLARSSFRKRIALAIPMAFFAGVILFISELDPRVALVDKHMMNPSTLIYLAIALPTAFSPVIAEATLFLWAALAYSELQERSDAHSRGGLITFGAISFCLGAVIVVAQCVTGRTVLWIGM